MNTNCHQQKLRLWLLVFSVALPAITQAASPSRYKLIDLGTFGGNRSTVGFGSRFLSNRGTLVGVADTSAPG